MKQLNDEVWYQIRDHVESPTKDRITLQVWHETRTQVWNQVVIPVSDLVNDQIWEQLLAQLEEELEKVDGKY